MPFVTLGLSPTLAHPLGRLGYSEPTPVQARTIPVALEGRDVIARAQTGTGKTAAFGLPMLERLLVRGDRKPSGRKPRGLVLVPTRELALQVHDALRAFGAPVRLRSVAIFGGVGMAPQVSALARGVDLVVATPGRLIDHLERRTVDLSAVEILTLDEADRMLDMGFLPPLRRILGSLPRERQTLLLSATFSDEIAALATQFMREPVRVDVSTRNRVASTVAHHVHPVAQERKRDLLVHLLDRDRQRQTLVFCRTKHGSNRVCRQLEQAGFRAAAIHGNKSQAARTRALADFKTGRVTVLVATDLASRGLDIEQLPLVINYDLPMVAQDYIHRIGRTGRAGAQGHAVSLVCDAEQEMLHEIQRLVAGSLELRPVSGFSSDRPLLAGGAPRVDSAPRHPRVPQSSRRPSAHGSASPPWRARTGRPSGSAGAGRRGRSHEGTA